MPMGPDDVIDQLGYLDAPENWVTAKQSDPATAHLWRSAKKAHVKGSYVFRTTPKSDPFLSARPAVHVAEAPNINEARSIHRSLWNLGTAPFVIIILPDHVRVYAGFNYDHKDDPD
jgi:hypothetical protein